mgnify:CR=1 FL=1
MYLHSDEEKTFIENADKLLFNNFNHEECKEESRSVNDSDSSMISSETYNVSSQIPLLSHKSYNVSSGFPLFSQESYNV